MADQRTGPSFACTAAHVFLGLLGWLVIVSTSRGQDPTDPAEVLGFQSCAKCHEAEVEVWSKTPHHATFDTLHRKPEAREIARRLDLRSIKRNDLCVTCHYTQREQAGRTRTVSGVSCESCHGAAKDWVDVHANYGEGVTRENESTQHRLLRRQQSIQLGMRSPSNLYLIARSCLGCHTTPNERLVNQGTHPAGSDDFELVAWSQGSIRHNFLRSEGRSNLIASPSRLRVMYIVGILTDLEFTLRATAKATERARFGVINARRADRLRKKLAEICQIVPDPLLQQALQAANGVELKLNNQAELLNAAERIGSVAYKFAERADGRAMGGIDPLLPSPADYR